MNNGHLASNEAEVDKFEGFTAFGSPLIITNNTIDITMNFNVRVAAAPWPQQEQTEYIWASELSAAMFTTTERKRSRGAKITKSVLLFYLLIMLLL